MPIDLFEKLVFKNCNCADLGSGAGLPGIIFAICFPEVEFTLIEAQQKRYYFLQDQVGSLNLKNLKVINCRVEDVTEKYDFILARAFQKPLATLELSLYALAERVKFFTGDHRDLIKLLTI